MLVLYSFNARERFDPPDQRVPFRPTRPERNVSVRKNLLTAMSSKGCSLQLSLIQILITSSRRDWNFSRGRDFLFERVISRVEYEEVILTETGEFDGTYLWMKRCAKCCKPLLKKSNLPDHHLLVFQISFVEVRSHLVKGNLALCCLAIIEVVIGIHSFIN
jgi:hypothetical protein